MPVTPPTDHTLKRTLLEIVHYPPHEPRKSDVNAGVFRAARKHLIDVLGVGCWIGGATKLDIVNGLPEGHRCFGAKVLEAHHNVGELAGLNALDWEKVAADFPQLGIHSDEEFKRAANSEGGLLIICDLHHRHPQRGIHAITYPAWTLDRYAKPDWEFEVGT